MITGFSISFFNTNIINLSASGLNLEAFGEELFLQWYSYCFHLQMNITAGVWARCRFLDRSWNTIDWYLHDGLIHEKQLLKVQIP